VDLGGPYLGFNIGDGRGKPNTDTVLSDAVAATPLLATNNSPKLDGLILGGQMGYNWLAGPWLFGIENGLPTRGPTCEQEPGLSGRHLQSGCRRLRPRCAGQWDLRATAGSVRDFARPARRSRHARAIAYVTGGLAVGKIKTSGTINGSSLTVTPVVDADGNPVLDDAGNPIVTAGLNSVGNTFFNQTGPRRDGRSAPASKPVSGDSNLTGKIEYLTWISAGSRPTPSIR